MVLLKELYLILGMSTSLLFVSKAAEKGCKNEFLGTQGCIRNKDGSVIVQADIKDEICVVRLAKGHISELANIAVGVEHSAKVVVSADLWHMRLGHPSPNALSNMVKKDLVKGQKVKAGAFEQLKEELCEPCVLGKQLHQPFVESQKKDLVKGLKVKAEAFQQLKEELCEPCVLGKQLHQPFVESQKKDLVKGMKVKAEAFQQLKKELCEPCVLGKQLHQPFVESQKKDLVKGMKVKAEAFQQLKKELCEPCVLGKQVHQPFVESQSANSEILELLHMDVVRLMTVSSAGGYRNNTLSIVHGITPLEVFTGEKPDVSNLRVFGSTCYAHVPVEKRSKLQPGRTVASVLLLEADSKPTSDEGEKEVQEKVQTTPVDVVDLSDEEEVAVEEVVAGRRVNPPRTRQAPNRLGFGRRTAGLRSAAVALEAAAPRNNSELATVPLFMHVAYVS
ncbi:hypothetical protein AXG93_2490s1500 [Marchantia polymorpha subsp. ruderalis]|uniref:GAG-pre-integrase domain-containing protein n=1 Tax=Marchantia polymorpha subsp. ruderalis TaxID=1480154 RepID=A0A176W5R9_MARPO|nr:hypothetical protein AXG93_2490s1500 [Marchantia polymorpha subsp. ruderalis]